MIEVNGSQIAVMELLAMYCLYQVDVKKFVVPLLLLKKFSGALGTTLAWGACSVIAGGETWERLCCVSITVVYKELLPPSFVKHVAADYTLDASNIFTKYPKVTTNTNIEELKENMFTIHPNQVNSYLDFVNFPGSERILQFAPQSAMADGLIDFGTKEFVVAIIAKYYSQEQAIKNFGPMFLETELEKLKCLVEGEKKQYKKVLALFVAPFLSNTYNEAKGKLFCGENNFLSDTSRESFQVPEGITLLKADPEILQKEIPLEFLATKLN